MYVSLFAFTVTCSTLPGPQSTTCHAVITISPPTKTPDPLPFVRLLHTAWTSAANDIVLDVRRAPAVCGGSVRHESCENTIAMNSK